MSAVTSVLAPIAAVAAAMAAGVTFIFSNAIMRALARQGDEQGAATMVAINEIILNPAFFAVFLGPGLLCAAAAAGAWIDGHPDRLQIALGAVVYLVGLIGVTAAANVPLNDALAAKTPGSREGVALWQEYLLRWTWWNSVRTVAGAVSALLLVLASRGGGA